MTPFDESVRAKVRPRESEMERNTILSMKLSDIWKMYYIVSICDQTYQVVYVPGGTSPVTHRTTQWPTIMKIVFLLH